MLEPLAAIQRHAVEFRRPTFRGQSRMPAATTWGRSDVAATDGAP
jgi:hypothetical protein